MQYELLVEVLDNKVVDNHNVCRYGDFIVQTEFHDWRVGKTNIHTVPIAYSLWQLNRRAHRAVPIDEVRQVGLVNDDYISRLMKSLALHGWMLSDPLSFRKLSTSYLSLGSTDLVGFVEIPMYKG